MSDNRIGSKGVGGELKVITAIAGMLGFAAAGTLYAFEAAPSKHEAVRYNLNAALKSVPIDPTYRLPGNYIDPSMEYNIQFTSERVSSGLWKGGPGLIALTDYPGDEIDYVVNGAVVLTDLKNGRIQRFRKGDHFVVPEGFNGTMEFKERTTFLFHHIFGSTEGNQDR